MTILLQVDSITNNGAVSAGWMLTGAFIMIGFLLVFIAGYIGKHFISALDTIKDELKESAKKHELHSEKHKDLETKVLLMQEVHNRKHAENTAALILSELKIKGAGEKGFR